MWRCNLGFWDQVFLFLLISILIFHNYTIDNMPPGKSDIAITRKIKESGNVMDVQLLDHLIIILDGRYYSMADEGVI